MAEKETENTIKQEELVDISENLLLIQHPKVFGKLLKDHTTHKNIFWATDSYAERGEGYQFGDQITIERITGDNGSIIQPRAVKEREVQTQRSKDMAEVFTPSWICNAQNNLVDEAWFGRKDVFNTEHPDTHNWTPTEGKIAFPEDVKGKSWKDYVREQRLEITCGEAPYIVSRYDTVTGIPIRDLNRRVGILDRKLRVVSENTETSGDWLEWAKEALMATYGFEWQGDNLLLAREAVFYTFCDYYREKFQTEVPERSLEGMAYIISWNLWQMDGLKYVVPCSCENVPEDQGFLFGGPLQMKECPACKKGDRFGHIGIKCMVRDWHMSKPKDWAPGKGEENEYKPWQKKSFVSLCRK